MSGWTHSICDRCWPAWCVGSGRAVFEPVRVRSSNMMPCCVCGDDTDGGIFVRGNPAILPCQGTNGVHERET